MELHLIVIGALFAATAVAIEIHFVVDVALDEVGDFGVRICKDASVALKLGVIYQSSYIRSLEKSSQFQISPVKFCIIDLTFA